VQLIDGAGGQTLWSERFDDRLDDIFDLQDRIAAQVAGQISPNLRAAEIARADRRKTGGRTAHELYLTAYPPFWNHDRDGNRTALQQLDRCLAVDPGHGPALALKAWCLAQEVAYMYTDDPDRDRALALSALETAKEHIADHAPSLTAIGAAVSLVTEDIEQANSFIDHALAVDPSNAWAWMRRGWARAYVGNLDEAIAALDHAEKLSPLDPFRFNFLLGKAAAISHWADHSTDGNAEAIALAKEAHRLNPKAKWIYRVLASHNYIGGNIEASAEAARELLKAYPHLTIAYLKKTLPPTGFSKSPVYFSYLQAAGIPEE